MNTLDLHPEERLEKNTHSVYFSRLLTNTTTMQYWLMKSEPSEYGIDDLEREGRTMWDGVRNYQARNFMRDSMQEGDVVFFYHSNVKEPGIVGEGTVCSKPYPDPTAFDKKDIHYDPKSTQDTPTWYLVEVCYANTYPKTVTLNTIRNDAMLGTMRVAQRGNRLSITPATAEEAKRIRSLGQQ